jgi:hypothetical protein
MRCLVRTCAVVCQKCKITTVKNYGKIPLPTHHKLEPWEEIHVDLISPWDVRFNSTNIPGKSTIEKIHAMTVIDKTTGLPEFIAIKKVHLTMVDMFCTMTFSGADWFGELQCT